MSIKSIKTKYLLAGISICLVSLLLISAASYYVSYKITAEQLNLRVQATGGKNAAELDLWFRQFGQVVEDLASDIEALDNYDPDHLSKLLSAKANRYNAEVFDFYMGLADNHLVSGISWTPPAGYDCRNRNWYTQAADSTGIIYTKPYLDPQAGKMVITIARAVKKNGVLAGVLAADIFVDQVLNVVGNYSFGEGSYAFLLDQEGNFLVHPQKSFLPDEKGMKHVGAVSGGRYSQLLPTATNHQVGIVELTDYDGESKYFILSEIKSCGWVLGITVMKSEYQKPLSSLFYGFMAALILSLTAGVVIMSKLINGMIQPIQSLSDTVKMFSAKNMAVRVKVNTDDEIGELGASFNQMAATIQEYSHSLEQKVAERTQELQEKNDSMMESIDYAERLQRATLPSLAQRLGVAEEKCFVVWQPKDIVGGDLYWCRGDERYALVAVVDCTGHGVPGALMSMTLGSILDGLPRELAGQQPSMLLHTIHAKLKETLGQDRQDSWVNDGADVALCLIDRQDRRILFAGARLSLFVEHDGQITEYKGVRHSVGYSWRKEVSFSDCEIEWSSGSTFYMTTDGLLDQNEEEEKGGMGRTAFTRFLQSMAGWPLPEQKQAVEELIAGRLSKVEQRDDITVIGFQI